MADQGFTRARQVANRGTINHSWIVYAVDNKGNRSRDSNTVTYRTPADVTPPSTPKLSAPFVGPTRVELDWTDTLVVTTPAADNSSAPTAPGNLRGFESGAARRG